jgi:hypothetical protein
MSDIKKECKCHEILELRICEAKYLVLRPNQLYIFTVDENCTSCVREARLSNLYPEETLPNQQTK